MAVGEEDDPVIRMINSAAALRSETLDLGQKEIYEIPKEILNLKHLESLHLAANYITELPEEFFDKLTNLKWLDLRNNRLSALPASIGKHRSLRSLLLEGNLLTHLPCELGMTKSLCGLSLSSNPLEFPPPNIVKKGTQQVLKYLREVYDKSGWTEEKYPDSLPSDQESEDMDFSSGVEITDAQNSSPSHNAGFEQCAVEENPRKVSGFKLPPIVRNATTVRRSSSDDYDQRDSVQGQTVKRFEPIRRSMMEANMPPLSETIDTVTRKRRSKRMERESEGSESISRKDDVIDVVMEEAPRREEKMPETSKKTKIRKKTSPKKAKRAMRSEQDTSNNDLPPLSVVQEAFSVERALEEKARFSVLVGDMVAIKVPEKHFIKGQPCVGKVVAEPDHKDQVLVHYFIGTYEDGFRPMMSRSSPYLRKVPLENILCKFEMQSDGRLSPRTAIRIRQMVERPGRRKRLLKPLIATSDFPEPVNAPVTFYHAPKRIDQLRYEYDKLRISSLETRDTPSGPPRRRASLPDAEPKKLRHSRTKPKHPKAPLDSYNPSSADSLRMAKTAKEKRLRRTASLNHKEAVQQQRIKNKMAIDDWRQETRKMQQRKQYEAIRKGITKVKIPSPFATEDSHGADEKKGTQKKVNEYNKRLQSLLEMNDKELSRKVLKDRQLESRIKEHMKKIREHREMNFRNVTDEVEEARNDLELAHKLQEELMQRRAMEYRLRAFTGDDFVPNPRYYKNNR